MKNVFLGILLLLIRPCLVHGQVEYVTSGESLINLNQPWTSTGLTVSSQDTVSIHVAGIATMSVSTPHSWFGPDGYISALNTYPLPTAPAGSVIGKIGSGGTPFSVGSHAQIHPTGSAVPDTLYLGINDVINFNDNSGTFVTHVHKTKRIPVIVVGVHLGDPKIPITATLSQNYPNPFNPSTTIRYGLLARSHVSLTVFNTLGQQVTVLQNGEQEAGYHEVRFDAANLSSGVYFYRLTSGTYVETRKLLLIR